MKVRNKIIILILFLSISTIAKAQVFEVSYNEKLIDGNFSGNILLYLSKENKNPKNVFVGLELIPVFRIVVEELEAGESVTITDDAVSYPVELSNIERGKYHAQVVFDLNQAGDASIGFATGNLYSESSLVNLNKEFDAVFKLKATEVIAPTMLQETEFLKDLRVKINTTQ